MSCLCACQVSTQKCHYNLQFLDSYRSSYCCHRSARGITYQETRSLRTSRSIGRYVARRSSPGVRSGLVSDWEGASNWPLLISGMGGIVEMRWKLTRRSLTGAALWLVLAVICIIGPFDELADNSDLFELLGAILGETGAKYAVALFLAALGIYSLQERVPRRRRSTTPNGSAGTSKVSKWGPSNNKYSCSLEISERPRSCAQFDLRQGFNVIAGPISSGGFNG